MKLFRALALLSAFFAVAVTAATAANTPVAEAPPADDAKTVAAAPVNDTRVDATQYVCGSTPSPKDLKTAEDSFNSKLSAYKGNATEDASRIGVINVYWHVITRGVTPAEGNIYTDQITRQIAVLNQRYAGTGFQFRLVWIGRWRQANWFNYAGPGTSYQSAMKAYLRRGGPADLNVYSVGFTSIKEQGLLGYATFPYQVGNLKDDGVVLRYSAIPGGFTSGYTLGITLVHEVGHWVGLYHTFQGGCNGGDLVADTPAEAQPAYACQRRDSCAAPGLDDITNYMDYTNDFCKTHFTYGQVVRMRQQMAIFRHV